MRRSKKRRRPKSSLAKAKPTYGHADFSTYETSRWDKANAFMKSWWTRFAAACGAALWLVSTWDNTTPEIHFADPATSLFTLPLMVTNRSNLVPISSPVFLCVIERLEDNRRNVFRDSSFTVGLTTDIPRGGSRSYECPVKIGNGTVVTAATIRPVLEYRTLWINRRYSDRKFTWYPDAKPAGRWVESD